MVQPSLTTHRMQKNGIRPVTWVLNCGFGELLGMAIAGTTMFLHSTYLGEPQTTDDKLFILAIMLIAGLLEGGSIGFFQWRVLRRKFSGLTAKSWIGITVLAGIVGWAIGMVPSMNGSIQADTGINESPWWMMVLGGIGMGLVLGALFGIFQNMVLKHHLPNQWGWTLANAMGWGVAMGWIFLGAGLVGAHWPVGLVMLVAGLSGALAGLSVGLITARFLKGKGVFTI